MLYMVSTNRCGLGGGKRSLFMIQFVLFLYIYIYSNFKLLEEQSNCNKSFIIPLLFFKAAADRPSTFDERLRLCKVLKGFQVRTITINRVIAYMNSGDQH